MKVVTTIDGSEKASVSGVSGLGNWFVLCFECVS